MPQTIAIKDFFLGGIADSEYSGIANSVASIQGFNLHSEPGVAKINQALVKESGSVVDDEISKIIVASDGKSYLFGKTNGKIWERTSGGSYSLVHTNAIGPGILNAEEFNGYLYWFSATKVGRWQIGMAWGTANDSWASFTNGNTSHHPSYIKNLVLYIGDGYLVAQVDDSTGTPIFTADALDLPKKYAVSALGEVENDLLIGATSSANIITTQIFRWNTYSVSFTNNDIVPEAGINCFIPADNFVLVSAGTRGNLYVYNGANLQQFKRIPGVWTFSNKALIKSEAICVFNGIPYFGLSNISGNPTLQGVYSMGSFSTNYPQILNLEYILSTGNTSNVTIGAMAVVGDDFLVAWKDSNGGTSYGVDKIDWNNKCSVASIVSRKINLDRLNEKDTQVQIPYRNLPVGTSITLEASLNNGSYVSVPLYDDAPKKLYASVNRIPSCSTLKLKLTVGVSGNSAPEIEGVYLIIN